GHNQPPEAIEVEEIGQIRPTVVELSTELAKPNPLLSYVKQGAKTLRKALIAIGNWTAGKLDKAADAGMQVAGAGLRTWVWAQLNEPLHKALTSLIGWLFVVSKAIF